jgi:hypothetical protein
MDIQKILQDKVRNSTLLASVTALLFVSSFGISNLSLSSNTQAFATIDDNNNKIVDSIKKACPNYEGDGDIKGLATNILKACFHQCNQSSPTNPNPETTTFRKNILEFKASVTLPPIVSQGIEANFCD